MAKKVKPEVVQSTIKIRLDNKTVITVKNIEAFEMWKEKYPNAKILQQ